MSAILFQALQFFKNETDPSGVTYVLPNSGGSIVTYLAGGTTPAATSTDADGTVADNPVPLDASGRPNNGQGLWLNSGINYDLVVKDANGATIMTLSSVNGLSNASAGIASSYITSGAEPTLPGSSVLTSTGSVTVHTEFGETTLTTSSAFSQKTDDYIAIESDGGSTIVFTGTGPYQLFFDLAASLGSGWYINIINQSDSDLTIDPSGSQLINGASTFILKPGNGNFIVCSGASFYTPFSVFENNSPMTTEGDMIYQTNDLGTRLPIGGEGSLLTSSGGIPVWNALSVDVPHGGTGRNTSTTPYGIIAAGTTATGAHQTIGLGTQGQVLRSNGAGSLASMQNVSEYDWIYLGQLNSGNSWQDSDILSSSYTIFKLIVTGPISFDLPTDFKSYNIGFQFYNSSLLTAGYYTKIMENSLFDGTIGPFTSFRDGPDAYGLYISRDSNGPADPQLVSGEILITIDIDNELTWLQGTTLGKTDDANPPLTLGVNIPYGYATTVDRPTGIRLAAIVQKFWSYTSIAANGTGAINIYGYNDPSL